jgi:E3 ubiquitin-protein ligase SHPRH
MYVIRNELYQDIDDPAEHVEKLNKELETFRTTFNKRVKYFAALQEISDSVIQLGMID